jgi:hypothetical protein
MKKPATAFDMAGLIYLACLVTWLFWRQERQGLQQQG